MRAAVAAPTSDPALEEVRRRVEAVLDPELPVLTLSQLGVVRDVRAGAEPGQVVVEITPTYSGCPALEVMSHDVAQAVRRAGFRPDVRVVLSPAWTTDWITADGRKALSDAGIAPPGPAGRGAVTVQMGATRTAAPGGAPTTASGPSCPQCGSAAVEELARFGSTACKALMRCRACREPFDYVKPL